MRFVKNDQIILLSNKAVVEKSNPKKLFQSYWTKTEMFWLEIY